MPTTQEIIKEITLLTTESIAKSTTNKQRIEELERIIAELIKDYNQTKEELRNLLTRYNRDHHKILW